MSGNSVNIDSDDSILSSPHLSVDEDSDSSSDSYSSTACGSKTNSNSEELNDGVNGILFSEEFYKIAEKMKTTFHQKRMGGGLIAVCQVCGKKIKGSVRVTFNFIKHLKTQHPRKFSVFKSKKKANRQIVRRNSSLQQKILNFICETTTPLSIVSEPSFQRLFPGRKVPSRQSISRLLLEQHNKTVKCLREDLEKVKFVCLTADVWSGGKRSFLGYTCHWLNPDNLTRRSVALACRRFKASHSFDRVASLIGVINRQYKLPTEKIVYTITDNGSNFMQAFKEFGVELHDEDLEASDFGSDSDDDSSSDSGLEFHSINPRLSKQHFSCASNSLSLLATTDFNEIMASSSQHIRDIHKKAFGRCTQLWKKCKRSKSAEVIASIIKAKLPTPCAFRWSSLYDCVKKLLCHKANFTQLCCCLGIAAIPDEEVEYLEEYIKIMEPIAKAIDFLQTDKAMYFGYFVPTIVSLKVKMRRLQDEDLRYLSGINQRMQEFLLRRFEKFFSVQPEAWDAIVAAICVPEIKMRFIKTLLDTATVSEDDVKRTFNSYVLEHGKVAYAETSLVACQRREKSFLDFGDEDDSIQCGSKVEGNFLSDTLLYLADRDTTLNSLNKYKTVKNVFLKYNTPLSSSAPVERLLSFKGIVNRSRWQKLSDSEFEMLVLRKANRR